ncbi:formylmethanofuran--tetrahydromethanopterin N-formyltransferase [Candidatus Bathyarchaeota archaeon]|nr:formylmethanofuran--tetrahydromethanopterin N-formyltransferase [Candidatus Bathyarchaeota archaeon]
MLSRIEDTFAEAFEGVFSRVIVTAENAQTVRKAAQDSTATPSVVMGRIEGGIEKWLNRKETPDGRRGALVQFWVSLERGKTASLSLKKFKTELSYRIRQDILVKPFTSVFDASLNPEGRLDVMENVGHCGDGYEWIEERFGREMIVIPTMVPDFTIERYLGYSRGVMGANFWIMCKTKEALKQAGGKALKAISEIGGVIAPFGICSAGSKPETKFPKIGPTTNHPYCPSLRKQLGSASKTPKNVRYIPEIVINGVSLEAVKSSMKAGITSVLNVAGVVKVSAGNYGGQLGDYKIYLHELFE